MSRSPSSLFILASKLQSLYSTVPSCHLLTYGNHIYNFSTYCGADSKSIRSFSSFDEKRPQLELVKILQTMNLLTTVDQVAIRLLTDCSAFQEVPRYGRPSSAWSSQNASTVPHTHTHNISFPKSLDISGQAVFVLAFYYVLLEEQRIRKPSRRHHKIQSINQPALWTTASEGSLSLPWNDGQSQHRH
jgi:hypothetical protein